jgi:hypothetical protein
MNCLSENLTKKSFLKIKDQIFKLETKRGTLWYLQQCQQKQLIPKQLKVSQTQYSELPLHLAKKWKDIEQSTSTKLLKVAIEDAKTKFENKKVEVHENIKTFVGTLPVDAQPELFTQFDFTQNQHQQRIEKQQKQKLQFLKQKEHPTNEIEQHTTVNEKLRKNRRFLKKKEYEAKKGREKKKSITLFKNFSSQTFNKHTANLIQKGGTFVPLPTTVDRTGIQGAIKRFERKCLWKAYWFSESKEEEDYIVPLFPVAKDNLPSKPPPKPLEEALTSIRTEILSAPLNNVRDNLSYLEREAIQELVALSDQGKIVIQPLDKTGGLAVFDRQDYINGMEIILDDTCKTPTGQIKNYYSESSSDQLILGQKIIQEEVKKGLEKEYLSKEEAEAMSPKEAKPGRLYGLAKDHKEYDRIPPFRPIVSGSGSLTENISKFVDFHAKPLVASLPSFIEDTPDFLRSLEELKTESLPKEAIPVTIDVVGLYSNIPQDEAIDQMQDALNSRSQAAKTIVPSEFLIILLTLVLKLNIFTFNTNLFIQKMGVAMGTRCAPTVANIFMGTLEKLILCHAPGLTNIYKKFWRRFIDDIFLIWTGTEKELEDFIIYINSIHTTIKFTANYNFETKSVPFLDTLITINEGKIISDLYIKPTHSPQYLLPSSTHPPHCTKNIPYSLGYRILRICSEKNLFQKRLLELKQMLITRDYKEKIINEAFQRLKNISRAEDLKRVSSNKSTGKVTFVIPFDPRLPKISQIAQKHFNFRKQDPICNQIFEKGVQIAYKRHKNIKEILCKATLSNTRKRPSNRIEKGWKMCPKMCMTCMHSKNMMEFKVTATGETIKINQKITCTDSNVIYCVQCTICHQQYVGKTTSQFKTRVLAHRSSVGSNKGPVGEHFNLPGHQTSNMLVFAFEKVSDKDPFIVGARERFYIDRMDVVRQGINKNRTNK